MEPCTVLGVLKKSETFLKKARSNRHECKKALRMLRAYLVSLCLYGKHARLYVNIKLNAKLLANLVLAFPPLQLSRKLLLYFVSNTINKESNEADSHDNAMLRLKNKINLLYKSCTDN